MIVLLLFRVDDLKISLLLGGREHGSSSPAHPIHARHLSVRKNAESLRLPPFKKGGQGGFLNARVNSTARKIPLNPPFSKGEANGLDAFAKSDR
jgi:hypothetical protein